MAARFKKVAPAGFLDEDKFVNALGIVGIAGSDSYIAGRMSRPPPQLGSHKLGWVGEILWTMNFDGKSLKDNGFP